MTRGIQPYFVLHPDAEMVDVPNMPGAFLLVHETMPTIIVYSDGSKSYYENHFSETVQ